MLRGEDIFATSGAQGPPGTVPASDIFASFPDQEEPSGTPVDPGTSMDARVRRPILLNPDGGFSSEITITVDPRDPSNPVPGKWTVIPSIVDGKKVSPQEATAYAKKTGQHFGAYNTLADSEKDIARTHKELERRMAPEANQAWQEALGTDPAQTGALRDELWAPNAPAPQPAASSQGAASSALGSFVQGGADTLIDSAAGATRTLTHAPFVQFARNIPAVESVVPDDSTITDVASAAKAGVAGAFPEDPEQAKEFWRGTLPRGAGSMVGFIGAGVAGGAAGMSETAAASIAGATGQAEQLYQEAKQHGADDESAWRSFIVGLPIGATEGLPIGEALDRMDKITGGGMRRLLANAAKGAVEEGTQEFVQQVLSNETARAFFDKNRELMAGVGESSAAGGVLGFAMNAVLGAMGLHAHGGVGVNEGGPAAPGAPALEHAAETPDLMDLMEAENAPKDIAPAEELFAPELPSVSTGQQLAPGAAAESHDGRVTLGDKIDQFSPEDRAAIVRHEFAHTVAENRDLWKELDTAFWDLAEKDPTNPLVWDYSGPLGKIHRAFTFQNGKPRYNQAEAEEVAADLYAHSYADGSFKYFDPAKGEEVSVPIPQPIMDVLGKIEGDLGIWAKKNSRAARVSLEDMKTAFNLDDEQARTLAPLAEALGVTKDDVIERGQEPSSQDELLQVAHHGTPHVFDRFDIQKIGTGEGAQVYGHGLYFAENKAVAQEYKKNLSYKDSVRSFREQLPDDADFEEVEQSAKDGELPPQVARIVKALAADDWLGFDYPSQAISAAFKDAASGWKDFEASDETKAAIGDYGSLYTVDIPDEHVANMLDWDAPLAEQSPGVKAALKKLDQNPKFPATKATKGMRMAGGAREIPGSELYKTLAKALSKERTFGEGETQWTGNASDDKAASELLRDLGIPGIKYLDQGSRAQYHVPFGDGSGSQSFAEKAKAEAAARMHGTQVEFKPGTRNYVVFDDKIVKILDRNGKPVETDTLYQKGKDESPAFKKWFGDSKVVDANGKPQVLYHGTADDISAFDLNHENRKDTGWLGTGVYLTSDPELAGSYARLKAGKGSPNVMPLYARLENPYHATSQEKQRLQLISHSRGKEAGRAASDAWTQELKARGHDGVILDWKASEVGEKNASREVVVFDPAGVKSAIGNRGTYDSSNPDVLRQGEGKAKGSAQFLADGRAIIRGFQSGDVSTAIHEPAHVFRRRFLRKDVALEKRYGITDEQVDAVESWAGAKNGTWSKDAEEKWARGVERYVLEGKAPSTRLQPVFDKLKAWMGAIYQKVTHPDINVQIPDNVREVLDKVFSQVKLPAAEEIFAESAPSTALDRQPGQPPAGPPAVPPTGTEVGEPRGPAGKKLKPPISDVPTISYDMPKETLGQYLRRRLQDKFNRQKNVQEGAIRAGRPVSDDADAYNYQSRFADRVAARFARLEKQFLNPLLRRMSEAGVTADELGQYLYAKHAPERNKVMREETGTEFDGLSGMTDERARQVLTRFEGAGKTQALEGFAQEVYRMNRAALKSRLQAGLISPKLYKFLQERFKDGRYVPLFVESEKDQFASGGSGRGFSAVMAVRKLGGGSFEQRENPFYRAILEAENVIYEVEKNAAGQALAKFVRENPQDELYSISEGAPDPVEPGTELALHDPADPRHVPRKGSLAYPDVIQHGGERIYPGRNTWINKSGEVLVEDPTIEKRQNVMSVRENGREVLIEFHDEALARAWKNLDPVRANKFLRASAQWFRGINTMFSPVFIAKNLIKDTPAGYINMVGEGLKLREATHVVSRVPQAMKGVWQAARRNEHGEYQPVGAKLTTWADWAEDYNRAGGTTGFFLLDRDLIERAERIQREVRRYNRSSKSARDFGQVIDSTAQLVNDVNESIELANRLSFYRFLVEEKGVDRRQAALMGKDLTVNFSRKGELGAGLNALYVFSNATIQDMTRITRAIGRSRAVRGIISGIFALGFAQGMLNDWTDEEDADKLNRSKGYLFERNMVFLLPGGSAVHIPMPYGYNIFYGAGHLAYQAAKGRITKGEALKRLLMVVDASVNPISGATFPQMASPTVLDPFIQHATNTDWMGKEIRPEWNPFQAAQKESLRYFKGVSEPSKAISEWLSKHTGGGPRESGAVEISPELIDHYTQAFTGGVGEFFRQVIQDGVDLSKGEWPKVENAPFLSTFFKEAKGNLSKSVAYDTKRDSGDRVLDGEQLGTFYDNTLEALKKKEMTPEQALDLVNDVTRNQGQILATRRAGEDLDFKSERGKRFGDREVERLRRSPAYQRIKREAARRKK